MSPENQTSQPIDQDIIAQPSTSPPATAYSLPPTPPPPAPQAAYVPAVESVSYEPRGGYFSTIKTLFTNPQSYFSNRASSFLQVIIFPFINLVIMVCVLFVTTIATVLTMKSYGDSSTADKLNGEFWSSLFKGIGLSSLYAVLLLALVAGVIYLAALIAKNNSSYKDLVSIVSVFSLTFLATALTAVISLAFSWVDNSDFLSIVNIVNTTITSLVFAYSIFLIINGVSDLTGFNYFKSATIFVISTILIIFLTGKVIKDSSSYIRVDFGGYNNSITSSTSIVNALNSALDSYLKY